MKYNKFNRNEYASNEEFHSGIWDSISGTVDLIMLLGWMHIVPKSFIERCSNASIEIVNLHPTLQYQLIGRDIYPKIWNMYQDGMIRETGCIVHHVSEILDRGEIIHECQLDLTKCRDFEDYRYAMYGNGSINNAGLEKECVWQALIKLNEAFNSLLKEKRKKLEICEKKVAEICIKIEEYKNSDDIHCLINDNEEDEMDFSLCVTKEDILKKLQSELDLLEEEEVDYRLLLEADDEYAELKKQAEEAAHNFIIQERLNKLAGCHVMEYTPQGNVLLTYDVSRCSFKYYSDNIIPYRYLETVARKFVKQFNCRPIYVDMDEELKAAEEKWNKEKEEEKEGFPTAAESSSVFFVFWFSFLLFCFVC